MQRIPSRPYPSFAARALREDDGFGLIEVMVSAVLLIVLALGTLKLLDTSQAMSSMNRSRDVAASLAQADQESMRQLPLSQIAGGYHPDDRTKQVGEITYTISSSGDWTRDASGEVTCSAAGSSAGRGEYLTITSKVTWPGMAATRTKPVVFQSVVAPGVETFGADKGALAIKLKRADGTGAAGVSVASGAVSGQTDSDGCVVLNNLATGATKVEWNQDQWVDPDGQQDIVKDETIGDGTTAQDNGAYDLAGRLTVGFTDDGGNAAAWRTFSMTQTGMTSSNGLRTFPKTPGSPASSLTTDYTLYPFQSAYGVYAGNCTGNDPLSYSPPASFTGFKANMTPGGDATLNIPLQWARVLIQQSNGTALKSTAIKAVASPYTADTHMSACTEKTALTSYTTDANGYASIPLPYGVWKVCAQVPSGSQFLVGKTDAAGLSGQAINTEDTIGTYAANAPTLKLGGTATSTQCS